MLSSLKVALATTLLSGATVFACDPACVPTACPPGQNTNVDVEVEVEENGIVDPGFTVVRPGANGFVTVQLPGVGHGDGRFVVGPGSGGHGNLDPRSHFVMTMNDDDDQPHGLFLGRGGNPRVRSFTQSRGITIQSDSSGNFSVKLNGKDVPEQHIIRSDDGQVKILDDNGELVIELHTKDGHIALPHGKSFGLHLPHGFGHMHGQHGGLPGERGARPMIGITMVDVDPTLAEHLGLDPERVVMVGQVLEGQPAARSGVQKNDIITHVDGQAVVSPESIRETVQSKAEGHEVRLRVLRRGIPQDLVIPVEMVERTMPQGSGPSGFWRSNPLEEGQEGLFRLLPKEELEEYFVNPESEAWLGRWSESDFKKHFEHSQRRSHGAHEATIERLEERLERLEKMLHELLEQNKKTY